MKYIKKILVAGGAGYIGSHVIRLLDNAGYKVIVLDNLSAGHKEVISKWDLIEGNINDSSLVDDIVKEYQPDAVMHFAAFIEAGESVIKPIKYYQNNTASTLNFLEILLKNNINKFIFSSTAAVYGMPDTELITEELPLLPINPYGASKLFIEQILKDVSYSNNDFNYVALRYFNACGADPSGDTGEWHNPETHLIPLVLDAVLGRRENISIFGTDYNTPDGTCIRDYIHVNDLARAHIMALEYLLDGGKSDIFNLGYGKGYSVREIIDTAKKVTGKDFSVIESERRDGDPPILVADSTKVKDKFGWNPQHNDIEFIIQTAWQWAKKISNI